MEDCDPPPPELSPEEHEAALQLQDAKRLERQKPLDPHPGDADLPKVHSDDSVQPRRRYVNFAESFSTR